MHACWGPLHHMRVHQVHCMMHRRAGGHHPLLRGAHGKIAKANTTSASLVTHNRRAVRKLLSHVHMDCWLTLWAVHPACMQILTNALPYQRERLATQMAKEEYLKPLLDQFTVSTAHHSTYSHSTQGNSTRALHKDGPTACSTAKHRGGQDQSESTGQHTNEAQRWAVQLQHGHSTGSGRAYGNAIPTSMLDLEASAVDGCQVGAS